MKNKTTEQKYRFTSTSAGLAFESRYYAQKFIDEILDDEVGVDHFEIFFDQGFYFINMVQKVRVDRKYYLNFDIEDA